MVSTPPWTRVIAHVDLDQFYAAVEVLDFPELKGKPVIVGGRPDSRGVVSTASYEARKFGVRSAMASAQAARLCPQAIWRKPRMERYAEKSHEVHAVFDQFTDQIEPLSLDEAFLELTGSVRLFGTPEQLGQKIKDRIQQETGLIASAGVAESKFLAKIASDLKKPDGLVIVPPGQPAAQAFLAPLPISRIFGVGPKFAERLEVLGLKLIRDVTAADLKWLKARLGEESAMHLWNLAHGIDERPVESRERAKSIGRENTFAEDLRDYAVMERELLGFADEVASRLRASKLRCLGVTLKVKFGDFTVITRAASFEEATDLAEPLHQASVKMLREKVNFGNQGARLLGISATRLVKAGETTDSLFKDEKGERRRKAADAVDKLRAKFGDEAIKRGRLLEERQKTTGTPNDRIKPK
jgi:DNA polymerase-4